MRRYIGQKCPQVAQHGSYPAVKMGCLEESRYLLERDREMLKRRKALVMKQCRANSGNWRSTGRAENET